jgi:hypothetical protein
VNGIAGVKAMPENDVGPETIQADEWSNALPGPKSLKIVAACAMLIEAKQPLIAAKHAIRKRIGLLRITAPHVNSKAPAISDQLFVSPNIIVRETAPPMELLPVPP